MTRSLLFLLAVSLSGQTTFSDFTIDVKSHSTARIGWTTDVAITNWNLEWDTQATPPFANATAYRNDSSGPTWYYGWITAGNPTSIWTPWGHACETGYKLLVSGATGGWAPLNGTPTCTYTDSTHFTLNVDTTGASGATIGTARYLRWQQALAGLPANTTIYYRACENSGAACSGVQSFTTDATPANVYANPTLPTASGALTAPPTSFARIEAAVTNCANLQTAINTALGRGETGNVLLPIQKGLRCSFASSPGLTIGANTNSGYLVIRPDSANTELPPNGVRISTDWEASMVTLSSSVFGDGKLIISAASTDRIYLMGIVFENDFPTTYTKTITGAAAATPIVYTATAHGYSNNDILQIREVGGVTGANVTNCKVQNKADNTFECKGSSGIGSYTTGGYAIKNPPRAAHAISALSVTHFVMDRIIVRHVFPAMGYAGAIWVTRSYPSNTRSADINLINSYVYNVNDWVPVDPDTGERATCCSNTPYEGMVILSADRVLVQNNKLDIPGISVFDDADGINDLTFRRNLNDWNTAWKYTSAATGWPVTVRQQFEMKTCFRCLLNGNQFLNQWRGGFGQGTGGYNVPILFSGRSGNNGSEGFTGDYAFNDITITNNLIANAPGGINVGNAGGAQYDQQAIRNVLISNNLMYGISWGQRDAAPTTYGTPAFLIMGGPFENLRIENNTMWDNRRWNSEYSPWNPSVSFGGKARGAYFRFHDNFLAHNLGEGGYNVLTWPEATAEMKPTPVTSGVGIITSKFLHDVDFGGNVAVPGVTDSRLEANYTDPSKRYAQGACAIYWAERSGVACHGGSAPTAYENFAAIGFVDYANHDFRLKDSSLYASGGARRGSDDKNLGADADAIDAAVGKVKNVRVREISSSGATLSYTAPDTDACTVEYGPSAAWGTGSRSSDGGGDKGRNVTLGGLSGGTTYYYRLLCAAEQPSGSFQTP